MMSSFSTSHCGELVNQFWNAGTVTCPHDGTTIESHFHWHDAGYLLVLACKHCGKKAQVTRYSDPKRREFREWSAQEKQALAAEQSRGKPAECPVCNANVKYQRFYGAMLFVVECPRCGNIQQTCIETDDCGQLQTAGMEAQQGAGSVL